MQSYTLEGVAFSGAFVWYEWLLVSTVPRALLVRPCIMLWRSGSRSSLSDLPHPRKYAQIAERGTARWLRLCACGEVEERRSGGAEERRSGGAEERRSGGEVQRRALEWWMPREVRAG